MIYIRTKSELKKIAHSCEIDRDVLFHLEQYIKPGITTIELDYIAEDFILSKDATPGFKGLYGFPATLCISIDDEVVHGIPSKRKLKEGEIVSIDCGVFKNGYYGDHAKTFSVGVIHSSKQKLMDVTRGCLKAGIAAAKIGNRVGNIGNAVQKHAEENGFSVVRELVGHGIGRKLHEEPQIPNFGKVNTGARIKKGMCFAIEPMINMGSYEIYTADDGFTSKTNDGLASAHFEHTVTITENGAQILTI